MDIANKIWKDARLERRFDTSEGVLSIHLYNLDKIEIPRKDLIDRYDNILSEMYKFKNEEDYEKLREIWKSKNLHQQNEKFDGPIVKIFYQILHGELLKYEKHVEKSLQEMEELIEKEKHGKQ